LEYDIVLDIVRNFFLVSKSNIRHPNFYRSEPHSGPFFPSTDQPEEGNMSALKKIKAKFPAYLCCTAGVNSATDTQLIWPKLFNDDILPRSQERSSLSFYGTNAARRAGLWKTKEPAAEGSSLKPKFCSLKSLSANEFRNEKSTLHIQYSAICRGSPPPACPAAPAPWATETC
jgi:hypothetical protein